MKFKVNIILILLLTFSQKLNAQSNGGYSSLGFGKLDINPAFSGSSGLDINLSSSIMNANTRFSAISTSIDYGTPFYLNSSTGTVMKNGKLLETTSFSFNGGVSLHRLEVQSNFSSGTSWKMNTIAGTIGVSNAALRFAIQPTITSIRLSPEDLIFLSQLSFSTPTYNPNSGDDLSSLGFSSNKFDFATGLVWHTPVGISWLNRAWVGISLYNILSRNHFQILEADNQIKPRLSIQIGTWYSNQDSSKEKDRIKLRTSYGETIVSTSVIFNSAKYDNSLNGGFRVARFLTNGLVISGIARGKFNMNQSVVNIPSPIGQQSGLGIILGGSIGFSNNQINIGVTHEIPSISTMPSITRISLRFAYYVEKDMTLDTGPF